jgi:hypothetical protein
MKSKKLRRRQIFVLTPEETTTLLFVLVAFFLGVATKYYRASHSTPPTKTAVHDTAASAALPAQKRAEVKRRKVAK